MGSMAIRVERGRAEEAIRWLREGGYLDDERMIITCDSNVEIPVVSAPLDGGWEVVEQRRPSYKKPGLSHELIKNTLGLHDEAARALRHYEFLGDVLVVNLPEGTVNKGEIGRGLMRLIPRVKGVLNYSGIAGVYREPQVELIAGEAEETLHRENGCTFKMDPRKVMFSSGNHEERKRMALASKPSEVVLDMFAGIGQFTIPLAKYSKPKLVYAVEKNPNAFFYLTENVKINGLKNVEAIHGDCREVSPRGAADRVIMGYFNTLDFLPTALGALRDGGVIHHHLIVNKRMLAEEAEMLATRIEGMGYRARVGGLTVVKSYAPSMHHCVIDFSIGSTKIIRTSAQVRPWARG